MISAIREFLRLEAAAGNGEILGVHHRGCPGDLHAAWLRRMLKNLEASFARRGRGRDRHAMLELEYELDRGVQDR